MNLHHDEVRKQRSTLAVCPSAKENVCVTDILYEIIEKETYKKDYEEITLGTLFSYFIMMQIHKSFPIRSISLPLHQLMPESLPTTDLS